MGPRAGQSEHCTLSANQRQAGDFGWKRVGMRYFLLGLLIWWKPALGAGALSCLKEEGSLNEGRTSKNRK